jgi:hypothetical protein
MYFFLLVKRMCYNILPFSHNNFKKRALKKCKIVTSEKHPKPFFIFKALSFLPLFLVNLSEPLQGFIKTNFILVGFVLDPSSNTFYVPETNIISLRNCCWFLNIPIYCCCLGGGGVVLGYKLIFYIPIDDGMKKVHGRGGGI